jgi:hypothetical protein
MGGGRGVAPLNLNLGTRWGWVVSCRSGPLYHRVRTPDTHPRVGWVGSRAGLYVSVERNISYPLPGFETWTVQPIAQSRFKTVFTVFIILRNIWQIKIKNSSIITINNVYKMQGLQNVINDRTKQLHTIRTHSAYSHFTSVMNCFNNILPFRSEFTCRQLKPRAGK